MQRSTPLMVGRTVSGGFGGPYQDLTPRSTTTSHQHQNKGHFVYQTANSFIKSILLSNYIQAFYIKAVLLCTLLIIPNNVSITCNVARQRLKITGWRDCVFRIHARALDLCATPGNSTECIAAMRWVITDTAECQGESHTSSRFPVLGAHVVWQHDTTPQSLAAEFVSTSVKLSMRVCCVQITSLKKEIQAAFQICRQAKTRDIIQLYPLELSPNFLSPSDCYPCSHDRYPGYTLSLWSIHLLRISQSVGTGTSSSHSHATGCKYPASTETGGSCQAPNRSNHTFTTGRCEP